MLDSQNYKKLEILLKKFAKEEELKKVDLNNLKALRTLLIRISKRVTDEHWHSLAEVMVAADLHRRAMAIFKKLIKKSPKDKKALNGLGLVYVRIGELEKGLEFYNSALEVDDEYEIAWFNKGKALFKLEELKAAEKCFKKVVTINKRNVSAWNNLGLVLKLLGELEAAVKCYNTVLKIDRRYPYSWNNLGYAYIASGMHDKALRCFEEALKLEPNYESAKRGLALCSKKTK